MKIVLALVAAVSQAVTLTSNFKQTSDQDELTFEAVPQAAKFVGNDSVELTDD
jgi:hypothetical protein